ncbi:MAG TPA: Asp-tRNA(Asn)/Glu-tRNA(Gln) amidotransferase subunit GatA [Vicinamibacterales bacterium]|nr:Asp-tRNA(Asn)/Glu-tRNA(Gln) amidotransferase subunit GatA [Vicinamibacterales bacterium]
MSGATGPVILTRNQIARGERSAEAVTRDALAAIARQEPALGAYTAVAAERALGQAAAVDQARSRGETLGPLAGVPIAVKDNISTRGVPTTGGSKILAGYVPPYDATVITRLAAAGAVVIGKTNCDEFAMGSSTENSAYGATANPWALDRAPGGSSGGSAATVAARAVPAALGSDTGGSIRQPAAFCGIVGLKPTYGRVSRYGLLAFASSLDQIGPFAVTVEDAAAVLAVIAGHDDHDGTSAAQAVPAWTTDGDARGLRIGVPRAFIQGVDATVAQAFNEALAVWRDRGATVVDIALPNAPLAIPVYYLIATAEASSNLARYDGARYGYRTPITATDTLRDMYERTRDEGFGAEVKRRIMLGTYVLSAGYYDAYYLKAQQVRAKVRDDYAAAFTTVDVVATPTTPTPAFKLGEKTADPLQMYLADIFTVSANLAGVPAVSLPCGLSPDGLPIGCQLTATMWDEASLIRAGAAFQKATDWHLRAPAAMPAAV